jgi:hypothetical protein
MASTEAAVDRRRVVCSDGLNTEAAVDRKRVYSGGINRSSSRQKKSM